jgi:hypothetical protein
MLEGKKISNYNFLQIESCKRRDTLEESRTAHSEELRLSLAQVVPLHLMYRPGQALRVSGG